MITTLFAIMSATAATANALPNTTFAPFSAETFQEFGRWMANDNSKVGFKTGMGRAPTDDRLVSVYGGKASRVPRLDTVSSHETTTWARLKETLES